MLPLLMVLFRTVDEDELAECITLEEWESELTTIIHEHYQSNHKVIVSPIVRIKINEFYKAAMRNHPSLSEETVLKKANRMFKGLQVLIMTQGFPEARLNQEWRANGWRELVIEDFHFAFEVVDNVDGERIVVVRDAIHSLLYH